MITAKGLFLTVKERNKLSTRIKNNVCIDNVSGCWVWSGYVDKYGMMSFRGKKYRVHKLAYAVFHTDIEEQTIVCHHCDNPSCCNPEHLFLGTQLDNMQDMIKKGRNENIIRACRVMGKNNKKNFV